MVIRICLSVYCFITSILSIVLEAPDWMRYLSDNRSPDKICKLAMIAVPGLQRGKIFLELLVFTWQLLSNSAHNEMNFTEVTHHPCTEKLIHWHHVPFPCLPSGHILLFLSLLLCNFYRNAICELHLQEKNILRMVCWFYYGVGRFTD